MISMKILIASQHQSGIYNIGIIYNLSWSIDLFSNIISLNLKVGEYSYGIKTLDEHNTDAEYKAQGNPPKSHFKISADFKGRQLLLNGFTRYRIKPNSNKWHRKEYENVIIATW